MEELESLELEEVLKEWTCDDFKSFYEDVFPNGFDPFADPHDATVPETSLELISNSPGFFEDMTDLSQKYDNVEPEEALFELLRENESSGKASCNANLDFSKHIQNSAAGSTSGEVQKKSNTSHTKEKLAKEDTKVHTSTLTSASDEMKEGGTRKRKKSTKNRGNQTKWKIKKQVKDKKNN